MLQTKKLEALVQAVGCDLDALGYTPSKTRGSGLHPLQKPEALVQFKFVGLRQQ